MMKKLLSVLLVLTFVCSMSFAASAQPSNKCGENLQWSYSTDTKTLRIFGKGPMYNFTDDTRPQWSAYSVENVVFEYGVTSVGRYAFGGMYNSVKFSDTIKKLSSCAFAGADVDGEIILPKGLKTIGVYSLPTCTNKKLYIPSSVQRIRKNSFSNLFDTERFIVSKRNNKFKSVKGIVYDKKVRRMIAYPIAKKSKVYKAPKTLRYIGDGVLNGNLNLSKIVLSKSVRKLGRFNVGRSDVTIVVKSPKTVLNSEIEKNSSPTKNKRLNINYKYKNETETFYIREAWTA